MKKIKEYKGIIIIVLILVIGTFYWFEVRPAQARKECAKKSEISTGNYSWQTEILNKRYEDCLLKNGL